jgi:hypothetical protein
MSTTKNNFFQKNSISPESRSTINKFHAESRHISPGQLEVAAQPACIQGGNVKSSELYDVKGKPFIKKAGA